MKIIILMWRRQLIRYWRSRARMIGALGQPILFFLALGFGFGPVYAKAGAGNYIEFLTPGIMAMTILFTSMFTGMEVIWDRQFGFLKETMVAPISRSQIMLGKTLGGATIAVVQSLIVFIITLFFGFKLNWYLFPLTLVFMFIQAAAFTALGIAIASQLEDMQAFPIIMNFLIMPIFFLSGALFPLTNLPKVVDFITRIDPLSYGVDGLRGALTAATHYGLGVDFIVLGLATVFMVGLGTYLFQKVQV
jgi:ABC-2 type transport system permease protein